MARVLHRGSSSSLASSSVAARNADSSDSAEEKSSIELPAPRQLRAVAAAAAAADSLDALADGNSAGAPALESSLRDEQIDYDRLFSGAHAPTLQPISAVIRGRIPDWLNGVLLTNGPGLTAVGSDSYRHWFDPLALIQRFEIKDRQVSYSSRLLESQTLQRNQHANRIVCGEFGCAAHPDPTKSWLSRYFSYYLGKAPDDNNGANIVCFDGGVYALSECLTIHRVDANTSKSLASIDLKHSSDSIYMTSHPHFDSEGDMIALVCGGSGYSLLRVPPISQIRRNERDEKVISPPIVSEKQESEPNAFAATTCLCKIPSKTVSYHHSFGLTDTHAVIIESPLNLNLFKYTLRSFLRLSREECLEWNPEQKTQIRVVNWRSGKQSSLKLTTDACFVLHHINCYEEGDVLIVDVCAYRDASIMKALLLDKLRDGDFPNYAERAKAWRFVLPLKLTDDAQAGDNLLSFGRIQLETRARAVLQRDGSIYCVPEALCEKSFECPRINYAHCNGRKYRYCYGVEMPFDGSALFGSKVVKVDVQKRRSSEWRRDSVHQFANEPAFVARPDAELEDDGVLIVPVTCTQRAVPSFLLFLDARSMQEVARAELHAMIPLSNHAAFAAHKL